MPKICIETKKVGSNPNASQATKKNNIVFTSQKAAIDGATGKMVGIGDIEAQTEQVIKNILWIIEAAGGTRKDIMKINIYFKNEKDAAGLSAVYKKFFPDELPTRSLILTHFVSDEILVEMDAVAIVG